MGFGDLTKQLAQEAIESALRPDPPKPAPSTAKPPIAALTEDVSATIVKQVQGMQAALKENEELVVVFHNGHEALRVLDFFVPSTQVIILAGMDAQKNITRVISPAASLQLTCKVMKVEPTAKPVRIRFLTASARG